jgi:membrane protease YdiL (CAAX protease family)
MPSLVYVAMLQYRGRGPGEALAAVGLRRAQREGWLLGICVLVITTGLAYIAFRLIPVASVDSPNLVISRPDSITGYAVIGLLALAEEMFFRGFLAGLLIRRLGFTVGNTIQALTFLTPHLLLLQVTLLMWPILPVQLIAGWLLGWLCYRSGSIAPGSLAHAASNVIAPLLLYL